MRVLGACLFISLLATSVAAAQNQLGSSGNSDWSRDSGRASIDYKHPTIVLVMESAGGLRAAAAVRKALNDAGGSVLSLAQARSRSLVPDALITIGTAQTVQVVYWDRDGRSDVLSAPSPATAEQLHAVVFALSSALIDKHRNDSSPIARDVLLRTQMFEDPRASRMIYAMLGQVTRPTPRTNVLLRYEDF